MTENDRIGNGAEIKTAEQIQRLAELIKGQGPTRAYELITATAGV
jgi:hypothetical protein